MRTYQRWGCLRLDVGLHRQSLDVLPHLRHRDLELGTALLQTADLLWIFCWSQALQIEIQPSAQAGGENTAIPERKKGENGNTSASSVEESGYYGEKWATGTQMAMLLLQEPEWGMDVILTVYAGTETASSWVFQHTQTAVAITTRGWGGATR